MIEKVKVGSDQNIVDLAIQEYGSVEGLVAFAERNGLGVDRDPETGALVEVETSEVVVATTREFYKNQNIVVTTGKVYDNIFDETFDETFE